MCRNTWFALVTLLVLSIAAFTVVGGCDHDASDEDGDNNLGSVTEEDDGLALLPSGQGQHQVQRADHGQQFGLLDLPVEILVRIALSSGFSSCRSLSMTCWPLKHVTDNIVTRRGAFFIRHGVVFLSTKVLTRLSSEPKLMHSLIELMHMGQVNTLRVGIANFRPLMVEPPRGRNTAVEPTDLASNLVKPVLDALFASNVPCFVFQVALPVGLCADFAANTRRRQGRFVCESWSEYFGSLELDDQDRISIELLLEDMVYLHAIQTHMRLPETVYIGQSDNSGYDATGCLIGYVSGVAVRFVTTAARSFGRLAGDIVPRDAPDSKRKDPAWDRLTFGLDYPPDMAYPPLSLKDIRNYEYKIRDEIDGIHWVRERIPEWQEEEKQSGMPLLAPPAAEEDEVDHD